MATGGDMSDIYNTQSLNRKRLETIRSLPAEHQNLLTQGDRFLVHNASLINAKRIKDFPKIEFKPEKAHTVTISIFSYEGDAPIDRYTRSCIHAYALSSLYDTEWNQETNPLLVETLGPAISILSTYAPYSSLQDSGIEKNLKRCHIDVDKRTWLTLEAVKEETREIRDSVARAMGLDSFDSSPQVCTIVALSTLILIGKNVTEQNRDGWFRNRWKALAHVANVIVDADRVEPPLLRPCQALYSSASANQPIRSCMFRIMRTFASLVDDQNHVLFDRLVNLLQWAEMSHIWMIMDYIYDQNPDILNFPELHGPEIAAMSIAISFLKSYPKEDRAYLKLIYDHNDLRPLHSINFIYFTAAAHAISSITRSSMQNIVSRFSEGVKAFQGRVIAYMNEKSKIGALSAGASYTTNLPSIVRNALINSLEGASTSSYDVPDFVDKQPEARE